VLGEGKETLGTTVLDPEPDVILPMPEDSPWPFLTTLAMSAGFRRAAAALAVAGARLRHGDADRVDHLALAARRAGAEARLVHG
jgi:hypothetical protein